MKHIRNAAKGATVTLVLIALYGAWVSGRQNSDVPGSMQLMPGYRHEAGHSVDTAVGRIWRDGGPELSYEIGLHARNELWLHQRSNDLLWLKTIERDGTKVEIALSIATSSAFPESRAAAGRGRPHHLARRRPSHLWFRRDVIRSPESWSPVEEKHAVPAP